MMQLATAGRREWKSVTSPPTDKDHRRRELEGFVRLQLRAPSFTFGVIHSDPQLQLRNSSGRVVTTHTQKQEASHF